MILNEKNLRIFARSVLFQNKEVINEISFAPEVPDSLRLNTSIFNGYESRILDVHGPMNPELPEYKTSLEKSEEPIEASETVEEQPLGVKEEELTYEI
jgi:hypothetical protein